MEVLSLQIFVSLMLVLGSVLLFFHAQKGKVHEQADRLALLPLADDAGPARPASTDVDRETHSPKETEGARAHEEQR